MRSRHEIVSKGLLAAWIILAMAATANPAENEGRASIHELGATLQAKLASRRPALYHELRAATGPGAGDLNRNPDVALVYLDARGHPTYYGAMNVDAAETIGTDLIWPGGGYGLSLDGSSTLPGELGMWDMGPVRMTHYEFGGRVTQTDTLNSISNYHATRVAGTLVAAGLNVPAAKGMSYAAPLKAWDALDDITEMSLALGEDGLRISNHSYGVVTGWKMGGYWNEIYGGPGAWGPFWAGDSLVSYAEDYRFGFYTEEASDWDQLTHQVQDYTIIKAAGNDRWDVRPAEGTAYWVWSPTLLAWVQRTDVTAHLNDGELEGGYDTLPPISTAKNPIAVGAVEDIPGGYAQPSDVVLAAYSSWGPTDDGRIKPDLVANGTNLWTTSSTGDADYDNLSGTSAAAPSVAGSANLLVHLFEDARGNFPLSATVKAVLIQTAGEAGPADGPDYQHGWGLMNSLAAAELIDADAQTPGFIVEQSLAGGETDAFTFPVAGGAPLRLTLAWADVAGTPPAASVDPTDAMLVNDLDLRLEYLETGTVYQPWLLDPTNPAAPAGTGDNARDNVEQIHLANAAAGTWRVTVTHKGSLVSDQRYALVSSERLTFWRDATDSDLGDTNSGMGVAWGDFDNDGFDDIYLTVSGQPNRLYRNDRNGGFVDATPSGLDDASINPRSANWVDFDKDGDLDLYVVMLGTNLLFESDGNGGFTENASAFGLDDAGSSESSAWADYDLDGDLDLYLADNGTNKLYRNDGNSFTDVAAAAGVDVAIGSLSAAWGDYDNDGDPDIYVATGGANKLFDNLGNGTFALAADVPMGGTGEHSRGAAWGDYDNDGDLDLAIANDFDNTVRLFRNDGTGFTDVTSGALNQAGDWASLCWLDYDNDADLDLYVGRFDWNGTFGPNKLFENVGGVFVDASGPLTGDAGETFGLGTADYDRDGLPDLYLANLVAPNFAVSNTLLNNENPFGNNWLQVRLRGSYSDTRGTGARVRIVAAGLSQIREIAAGSGYCTQNSATAHFGLGAATYADSVIVEWPSGTVQVMEDVAVNHRLLFVESGGGKIEMIVNGDFSTGDLSGWTENKGWNPGHPEPQLTVEDVAGMPLALHVTRELDYDGSHAIVEQAIDAGIGGGGALELSFDVRIDDHNFARYDSWNVYPANFWVHYEDADGVEQVLRRSFYTWIDAGHTPDEYPLAEQIPASTWVSRDVDLSALDPAPARILRVRAGAQGWSYDVAVDNLSLDWTPILTGAPGDGEAAPATSSLLGNYPNPFNPTTTIRFAVADAGPVRLQVFDVQGRLVRTLVDGRMGPGRHEAVWSGQDERGTSATSGVYFYRLRTAAGAESRRMVLIK